MIRLEFPWPPAELMPNRANRHGGKWPYRKKAKMARTLAWGMVAQTRARIEGEGEIILHTEITPPEGRAGGGAGRDEDGLMAALKPYRDGIADALGVNDSRFRNERPEWKPKDGAGKVVITIA
jgi:crossover junction endodeoxyribonuclease RusA